MIISNDIKLDFDDVLLAPQRSTLSSRKEVTLTRDFQFYHSEQQISVLPLIAANMDCTGTYEMAFELDKFNAMTALSKYLDHPINYKNVFYTIGMSESASQAVKSIVKDYGPIPYLCIDVPNGYMQKFVEYCRNIRSIVGYDTIIMAGNVCTAEMTQELIIHGHVDIVKIGVGPGSVCSTRMVTGVGYPQLSAIMECASVAHGLKSSPRRLGLICADGGCKTPGDVAKAFAAGADFVMLGGMLAGTDECEGTWEDSGGKHTFFSYYGMSSYEAQAKYGGLEKTYRASEGLVKKIPAKGPVANVMKEILGGLASCGTYIGADSIKDFSKCAHFIRVNRIK